MNLNNIAQHKLCSICLRFLQYPISDPNCIEYGYHWAADTNRVDEMKLTDSAVECQVLCYQNDKCKWFAWKDLGNPNGCWLLDRKGSYTDSSYGRGATGPPFCQGITLIAMINWHN